VQFDVKVGGDTVHLYRLPSLPFHLVVLPVK
jgi:hypothetical protein